MVHTVTDIHQLDNAVRRQLYGLFRHLVPQSLGSCLRYIRDMEKVVEMESGGNAAGCGHEVVTVLSRITEEYRRGEGRRGRGFRDAPFQ